VKSSIYFLNKKPTASSMNIGDRMLELGACRIDIPQVREAIINLQRRGWDVGVHQSLESYANEELLRKEKEELEAITGVPCPGVRQHYLMMKMPDFWLAQEGAGFKYDSTVGFTQTVGFRTGTMFPYRAFDRVKEKALNLLEIPLTVMERNVFSDEKEPWEACREMIDIVEKQNGMLVILWHQRFFNENEFPGYAELYKKIIEYCQKRGAWVASLDEIYKWWAKR
jgi:peptidoglycan/xylan/chitin deacetylase (PgdA/CDA1 family)